MDECKSHYFLSQCHPQPFSVHKDEIISMVTDAYCQACPYVAELCPLDFLDLHRCRRVLEDMKGFPSCDSSQAQGNV